MQNVIFDENPHGNERIWVILGCAIGFLACAKHRCTGGWLKLCLNVLWTFWTIWNTQYLLVSGRVSSRYKSTRTPGGCDCRDGRVCNMASCRPVEVIHGCRSPPPKSPRESCGRSAAASLEQHTQLRSGFTQHREHEHELSTHWPLGHVAVTLNL